jgi:hypothetical protein
MVRQDQEMTWFGQPVTASNGTLAELRGRLPSFERRPFGPEGSENEFLQTIIRTPTNDDNRSIPVATVSRQYDLIQHQEVFGWLENGLKAIGEKPEELSGMLALTKYGERMRLRIRLPKYDFDPGDKYPLTPMVYALNSVDKSTALEIHLGWWRQVCSNGMKVRVKGSTTRRIHILGRKTASEIGGVLQDQLADLGVEHDRYNRWLNMPMDLDRIDRWADTAVARTWGPHAAARICHIARTGHDGQIEDPFENVLSHDLRVSSERQVPGAFAPVKNVYHVSQILSWLASHRATIQGQQERTVEIDRLMRALVRQRGGSQ